MPGVGKSYYGSYAAKKLNINFLDLDEEIEKEKKLTIAQLFKINGENEFRLIEKQILKKLIKTINSDTIVSTGGGTPCFNDALDLMKKSGAVVWLDATINLMLENFKRKTNLRPLFLEVNNNEMLQKLNEMLGNRTSFYKQSDVKVNVYRGLEPDLFTNKLHLSTFAKRA